MGCLVNWVAAGRPTIVCGHVKADINITSKHYPRLTQHCARSVTRLVRVARYPQLTI